MYRSIRRYCSIAGLIRRRYGKSDCLSIEIAMRSSSLLLLAPGDSLLGVAAGAGADTVVVTAGIRAIRGFVLQTSSRCWSGFAD